MIYIVHQNKTFVMSKPVSSVGKHHKYHLSKSTLLLGCRCESTYDYKLIISPLHERCSNKYTIGLWGECIEWKQRVSLWYCWYTLMNLKLDELKTLMQRDIIGIFLYMYLKYKINIVAKYKAHQCLICQLLVYFVSCFESYDQLLFDHVCSRSYVCLVGQASNSSLSLRQFLQLKVYSSCMKESKWNCSIRLYIWTYMDIDFL